MTLSGLLCCPQNDSVTVGFLSATSDIDLQLLQDFDLSEFEGLFGQSEDNNDDNNSSTGGGGGAAEGAAQATPTQPETNQEAENAEQPSEEQQVNKEIPPQLLQTARRTGSRALTQFHLRPAGGGGGGGAAGGEAQRLRHSAVRHQQDLRDEVRQ